MNKLRLANDVTALFSAVAALMANKSLILRIKQFGVALSMVQLSKGRECAARSNFGRRRRMLHHRSSIRIVADFQAQIFRLNTDLFYIYLLSF